MSIKKDIKEPILSIIVPVYNVEKYLHKCIDSLINQTLKDIEIILVNDGSTDDSGNICDEYKIIDNRIKVIHKENGGLSDARNYGLDISRGKYVAFLDSDDWLELDMYEKLYNYIIRENTDIAQCSYEKVYDDNSILDKNIKEEISLYTGQSILNNLYKQNGEKNIVVWNKIYKKSLFDNIRFPKGKCHEDEFTTYKVLHKAKNIVDSNIPLVYYRQRKNSIMNSEFNIKRLDIIEALKERIKYFNENKLNELERQTESQYFYILKDLYINTVNSNIYEKNNIIKDLKSQVKNNYFIFIRNNYINIKNKIIMTILILNERAYRIILKIKGCY